MRLRPAVLAACVLTGVAVLPAARASVVSRPDPCTLSYDAPSGDAPVMYVAPSDPDLDVTHVTWQVGVTDVVVTAKMAGLAGRPTAAWGDQFAAVLDDKAGGGRASFGYFRTPSGGGPVYFGPKAPQAAAPGGYAWTAYPGGVTHLVADFDVARSQVVLTIPRADLSAAFGKSFSSMTLTVLGVDTYAMDAAYNQVMADFGHAATDPRVTSFSVAACDRWLARRHARAAAPGPCGVDVVAATGDETSRTSDVAPTRDDSVDVARVSYRLSAKDLTVTIRVARLTDRPLVGTGQGYVAAFAYRNAVAQFGVTRDAVDGTKVRQFAGTTVTPLTVQAAFDPLRSTVTLVIPRAAVAAAFGLTDSRALVIGSPGATSFWTVDGQSVSSADTDAVAAGRTLSFAACDRALKHR
jgi:hypothetical protein